VIGLSGDRHRRMRQLLMPSFHGERMRSYGQVIQDITKEVMNEPVAGEPLDVRKIMQKISMRVILRAVFGLNEGPRYQQLERLLASMRNRQQIDQLVYDEIAERRSHPDDSRTDILNLLLSARDEAGEALTDSELRDELMTLLVTGHETTATALTWALYWIHKLPAVRKKLLTELQALDGPPDPYVVIRLPYLNAVCSETLRIYPVGILTFSAGHQIPS
jgi:cytochrome P450